MKHELRSESEDLVRICNKVLGSINTDNPKEAIILLEDLEDKANELRNKLINE